MLSLEMVNFCLEGNCPGARCFGFAARASEGGLTGRLRQQQCTVLLDVLAQLRETSSFLGV